MNKLLLITSCAASLSLGLSAQNVISDPFGDGTIANNSGINTNVPARQSGTTSTTYSLIGTTGNLAISNSDGVTSGNNMARLRNNEQDAGASDNFMALDSSFTSLAGQSYEISFDFLYNKRATSTTDQWISFTLGDTTASQGSPAGAAVDFGILLRPDGVGNPGVGDNFGRFYEDGVFGAGNDVTTVPSYTGNYVTFVIAVNETGGTPLVTVTAGASVLLSNFAIDFENADRFFSFGSHLGADTNGPNATEFSDLYIDNFSVSIVPEPSAFALLGGLLALSWVAIRRRG